MNGIDLDLAEIVSASARRLRHDTGAETIDALIAEVRRLRSELAVLREQRAAAKSIPLVDVIAAALCDQEEAAEKNGDEPWWGNGTDYTAQITAEAVRSSIVAALEEPR